MNNKTPLWLPSGSVRSLIALSLVGSVIYLGVGRGDIPQILGTLAGVAVGYYFQKRTNEESPK